jgi:hypothetical protein
MYDLIEEIKKDPYNFICDFYERTYMHIGKEVFSILSLVIPSLILPAIPHRHARDIKASINMLLICPPGNGKSGIAETFEKLAYNAFPFESITDAKLYEVMSQKDYVSVIVGDVFKIFSDKILSKTMENILGDEQKISRMTKRTDSTEKKIRACAFLAGTPNSLTSVISDGMLFRTAVCLVFHNPDEHEDIGVKIGRGTFEEREGGDGEEAIREFYQELLRIQLNVHRNIDPIYKYGVSDAQRNRIIDAWKPLVRGITRKTNFSFFRELHQGYRYMIAHAFLNIFNRKNDNGILVIDDKDVEVAIKLMTNEIKVKEEILNCSSVVSEQRMKTTKDLSDYVDKAKKQNKSIKPSYNGKPT